MPGGSWGVILATRAVVLGAVKARDLLDIAVDAERSGMFDAVWVGDSLLAKPRLESVTLLSALAGVTERVRLAVGCLATFVHRHPVLFAQQWASLDVLSGGRAWLAGSPDRRQPPRTLLPVPRRHARAPARPEPVPDLDRLQSDRAHVEGRRQRLQR